jgi:cytochrome P450
LTIPSPHSLADDYKITGLHNPLAAQFEHVNTEKLNLLSPGSSFYDVLPAFVRPYVPAALMPSLKSALQTRDKSEELDKSMADLVAQRLANGEDTSSFMAGLLTREKEGKALITPFERNSVTGHLVAAAGDTTQSALRLCILAAICFPEATKRVQAQIDSVVGRERLPVTEDVAQLPLVKAFVLEALRWRSVTRVGVPHCLDEVRSALSASHWLIRAFTKG